MAAVHRILFVDDEPNFQRAFERLMRKEERFHVEMASDGRQALEMLKTYPADMVVTDMRMPQMDGLSLLKEIKRFYPEKFVVVITGHGSIDNAVQAMKLGAYDYLLKPFDQDVIKMALNSIADHHDLLQSGWQEAGQGTDGFGIENIIGQDRQMFKIYETVNRVAQTDVPVMIMGESGTGKELVAQAIHERSRRHAAPFMQINCGALTETIVNSELFGHEAGAFTGAAQAKKGLFEVADQGTLFLDEIGDIPIPAQIALLRVIELGTFQRVGGIDTLTTDTRLICATNQDLKTAVRAKRFREDLYYRLNVVTIQIPPLRDRKSDLPLLAAYFLRKSRHRISHKISGISKKAMQALRRYDWPGNVRELANAVDHAAIFSKGPNIMPEDLPEEVLTQGTSAPLQLELETPSLAQAEKALIRKVLEDTDWNLKQTAQELGIARGTLYSKMRKNGLMRDS